VEPPPQKKEETEKTKTLKGATGRVMPPPVAKPRGASPSEKGRDTEIFKFLSHVFKML
jgi:hypothetical protein